MCLEYYTSIILYISKCKVLELVIGKIEVFKIVIFINVKCLLIKYDF